MKKMNKIVAGVSAAALAASAMATSAMAEDFTLSFEDDIFASWTVNVKASNAFTLVAKSAAGTPVYLYPNFESNITMMGANLGTTLKIRDVSVVADAVDYAVLNTGTHGITGECSVNKDAIELITSEKEKIGEYKDSQKFFSAYDAVSTADSTITTTVTFEFDCNATALKDILGTTNATAYLADDGKNYKSGMQDALERKITRGTIGVEKGQFKVEAAVNIGTTANDAASATTTSILDTQLGTNAGDGTVADSTFIVTGIKRNTKKAYVNLGTEAPLGNTLSTGLSLTSKLLVPQLQKLQNGGKMTVKLAKAVPADKQAVIRASFVNDMGMVLKSSEAQYINNGDTLVFDIPALNSFASSTGTYAVPMLVFEQIGYSVEQWTTHTDLPVATITFTTNDGAVVEGTTEAPKTNEGDSNTNKPANNNGGDDKNQPTGVAIAIVPAIAAAAGVVISKKRK